VAAALALSPYGISAALFHANAQTWTWIVLIVPVAAAFTPAVTTMRALRVAAGVFQFGLCVMGMFSVGIFFLPSAIALAVAAWRIGPTRPRAAAPA
jgi:hypothetical protein